MKWRLTRTWTRRTAWIAIPVIACSWLVALSVAVNEFGKRDWLRYGSPDKPRPVDAIVVLGAGVDYDRPSPVFEARLRHAVELYFEGVAPILLFTGGLGRGDRLTESEVGSNYARAEGIPASAILIETNSRTTLGNLMETRRLLDSAHEGKRIALVSDPHHLLRASWMAHQLNFSLWPSPTPYTRYRSASSKFPAVLREVYFLHHYAFFGR